VYVSIFASWEADFTTKAACSWLNCQVEFEIKKNRFQKQGQIGRNNGWACGPLVAA
jgi:hypothetical protein